MNTVERAGWHADLWFPVVERSRLGLRTVATDQDVHAAVVGLIRKRALVHVDPEGWRPPNFSPPPDIRGPILPSPGYLALAHRMPLVQPGPVELALETADRSDQVASQAFSTKPDYRVEDEKTGLSELEAHILTSIDHVWLVRISLVSRCCERDAELWLKGTRGKCALSNHRPHSEGGFGPDQFGRNTHGILCRASRGTHVARSGCWDLPTLLRHDRWARYRCEE